MEKVLSYLNSHTEPWRGFGSAFLSTDPTWILLSSGGLLLIFLCYMTWKPFSPTPCKYTDFKKRQVRAKRRRKGGTFKSWKTCQREEEEARKLLSVMKSPLGQHCDTTYARQLLCPDPLCELRNTTSANVSRVLCVSSSPLGQHCDTTYARQLLCPDPLCELRNTTSANVSPVLCVSSSPLGQHCDTTYARQLLCPDPLCELRNTTSANVSRVLSQTLLGDAALSSSRVASKQVVRKFSCIQTCDIIIIPPAHPIPASLLEPSLAPPTLSSPSQIIALRSSISFSAEVESVLPGPNPSMNCELAGDHFLLQTLLSQLPPNHHTQGAEPVLKPERSQSLEDSFDKLTIKDLSSAEASLKGHCLVDSVKDGNHLSLGFDNLKREIRETDNLLMSKEREKEAERFLKQKKSDNPLSSPRKTSESLAGKKGSALALPSCTSGGRAGELHAQPKHPHPKTLENHLEQNHSQLDHLLTLPTEFQNHIVPVSSDNATDVCINTISVANADFKFSVYPHIPPLTLPEIEPQPLPPNLPPSQSRNLPAEKDQAQLQSSSSVFPPSRLCQDKICGKCFRIPQDEVQPLTRSEIPQLKQNLLQKVQAHVWALTSAVQKSQADFCPPAPRLSLLSQANKSNVPVSILPGDFPLSSDLPKKLEHHLRKRLIQHRWGLPYRAHKSLSLMQPQRDSPEPSVSKDTFGLSWISSYKSESSQDLNNCKVTSSMTFHERPSEMHSQVERLEDGQGHGPVIDPEGHLVSDPQGALNNNLTSDSEKVLDSHLENLAQKHSGTLGVTLHQKELESALEGNLSTKSGEMQEDKLPDKVQRSWHNTNLTQASPEKPSSQVKERDLGVLMSEGSCPNTSRDISFISSDKIKLLEEHIKNFHRRTTWDLPHKVQESIEIFNIKEHPSQLFAHSVFLSSDTRSSGVDSKIGGMKPLRGIPNALQGVKLKTTNTVMDDSHPTLAQVGKEGQGVVSQSPLYTNQNLRVNIQTREGARQTFLAPPHSKIDTASQKQTIQGKRRSPKLSRQAEAGPEVHGKRNSSSRDTERLPSTMAANLEYFPVWNKFRGTFKAKGLCGLKSQSRNIVTSESEDIQETDTDANKAKPASTTDRPYTGTAVPKDHKSVHIRNQLFNDLKLEKTNRTQAQGLPTHGNQASQCPNEDVSSGATAAFQVLHVQEDDTKYMEQRQEPWVPRRVLSRFREKKFPSVTKRVGPRTLKEGNIGGGDAGLGPGQCRRRGCPDQVTTLKKTPGATSSSTSSLEGQPPPKKLFKNKVKDFFQHLCPCIKPRGQKSLEKNTSSSSGQTWDLPKEGAAFTGLP